jgi:uncharacterized protein YkwD
MKNILILFVILTNLCFSQDTLLENEIFKKINIHQNKKGLKSLNYNKEQVKSCREHSKYMSINNLLEHVKDIDKVNASAEIIQQTYSDEQTNSEIAKSVLQSFLNSPSHKKIIETQYTKISVGIFKNKEEIWITVRFF